MDQKDFQIRLTLKGKIPRLKSIQNSKPNHVVTVAPLMTMQELLDVAHEIFGVQKNNSKYVVELWGGFPPKKIDLVDAGSLASLVTANGVDRNDSVTVKIVSAAMAKKMNNTTTESSNLSNQQHHIQVVAEGSPRKRPIQVPDNEIKSSQSSASARPKRASAQAASESFKDVIRAQDKMLRNEKKQQKKSTKFTSSKTSSSTASPSSKQTAARKRAAEARAAAANARKFASLPGGRTLNGDNTTNNCTGPKASTGPRAISKVDKTAKSIFKGINSEEDVSFALISSISSSSSGSRSNGKLSKVLRGAMRKTVEKSYEASRAVVRNSAILASKSSSKSTSSSASNAVTFVPSQTQSGYTVRYPKGVEGVGFFEEEVHIITPLMLKAVIQAVYNSHEEDEFGDESGPTHDSGSEREMLKPQNMALLSPRVFWSLWYHFRDRCSSIEEALNVLLPELDWSFLHKRSRQLSEKAKDNLRQEKAMTMSSQQKDNHSKVEEDHEAGIKAVQEVERAMETMYDETVVNIRERAAQAALARFGNNDGTTVATKMDDWTIETPTEEDESELRECIVEYSDENDGNSNTAPGPGPSPGPLSDEVIGKCIRILMSEELSIYNWRMLANATSDTLYQSLCQHELHRDKDIDIATRIKTEAGIDPIITIDHINSWISSAQTRSMDEIMLDILEGDQDLFQVLRDDLSSGTPKDLSLWGAAPQFLMEEITELGMSSTSTSQSPLDAESTVTVKIEDLKMYCDRAKKALEEYDWLHMYSTSIV